MMMVHASLVLRISVSQHFHSSRFLRTNYTQKGLLSLGTESDTDRRFPRSF